MSASGDYQRQPNGYDAFVPNQLPIVPALNLDNDALRLLSKADRALGHLDGSVQSLPNPDLFVFMYVRKEAVLSSQIEGTQASIGDVLAVEAKVFDPIRPNDVGEVLNYVAAAPWPATAERASSLHAVDSGNPPAPDARRTRPTPDSR